MRYFRQCARLHPCHRYPQTIQERNRSLDQNRKLWACLGDVSRQVEWHGRWLDAESWKCVFKGHAKQVDAAYAKECALEGMARTQIIWLKEGVIKA
ncbi:hypothetical protein IGX47_000772 [Escherichia coli]|nr:hypothetical protein [Escherichia coli]